MVFSILIAVLVAYFLGNLNGAVSISTLFAHDDVRNHGSGNAGLTNFFRNYGGWYTLLVFLIDVGKAALACYAGALLMEPYGLYQEGMALAAVAVSLGHDFPALLGFRGGKGILCGFTIALAMDWRIGLLIFVVFALTFVLTHYVSLGSILASITFCISFAILHSDNPLVLVCGLLCGLLAFYMHHENLKRLINGTESKVFLTKRNQKS